MHESERIIGQLQGGFEQIQGQLNRLLEQQDKLEVALFEEAKTLRDRVAEHQIVDERVHMAMTVEIRLLKEDLATVGIKLHAFEKKIELVRNDLKVKWAIWIKRVARVLVPLLSMALGDHMTGDKVKHLLQGLLK